MFLILIPLKLLIQNLRVNALPRKAFLVRPSDMFVLAARAIATWAIVSPIALGTGVSPCKTTNSAESIWIAIMVTNDCLTVSISNIRARNCVNFGILC